MMLATLVIALITALSLWSSLSASVLERRKDFAVLKALGASNVSVTFLFLLEQAVLGLVGTVAGYGLGCAAAAAIGYYNFHSAIYPRIAVLPAVMAGVAVIVVAGSVVPLQRLQKIRPAAILKGE
jgi:putative ABC transport system permease protein